MAWEVAIISSLLLVALALFYLVGIFDKKEHAIFSLFLFFVGLFFIIINFNVDANILLANNNTEITDQTAYGNLEDNINTSYWLAIMVLFVSLAYWFIYLLRMALEALRLRKQNEIGE